MMVTLRQCLYYVLSLKRREKTNPIMELNVFHISNFQSIRNHLLIPPPPNQESRFNEGAGFWSATLSENDSGTGVFQRILQNF